jgi:tRNA pseudouridine32 synthase/23S rRNA pseudouridine746 synthase
VHRLDQGTSGVIVAAKTQPVAVKLSEAFAGREVQKTYLALVKGRLPPAESGVADAALVKVEEGGKARMIIARPDRKGAQGARTGWRIVARQGAYGLIQLAPETGRMHQIRVHLMSLGCPILGDALYGEGQATAPRPSGHWPCSRPSSSSPTSRCTGVSVSPTKSARTSCATFAIN